MAMPLALLRAFLAIPLLIGGWAALAAEAEALGVAAGELGELSGVSSPCQHDLQSFATCQVKSGFYTVCTNKKLLNTTQMQGLLGCANPTLGWAKRLKLCQSKCLRIASTVLNETVKQPCPPDIQAMHGFNEDLNIFTIGSMDGDLNVSSSLLLPFPNFKSPMGPSTIKYGNPDKCVQIPTAEYCMLTGEIPFKGFGGGPFGAEGPGMGSPSFQFAFGNCLPKTCNEAELRAMLTGLAGESAEKFKLKIQCGFVEALGTAEGASKKVEEFLGWGGVPIRHIRRIPVTAGFVLTLVMLGAIAALVLAGTSLELWKEAQQRRQCRAVAPVERQDEPFSGRHAEVAMPLAPHAAAAVSQAGSRRAAWGVLEGFLGHWSLVRNSRSFMRLRPPDKNPFACLDAIRTFSMCQVILGHSFMYPMLSSGLANLEQFSPPHGLLGSVWFMVVPGCFYGVDTFFLLSGFLCAHGLQKKVFSRPEFRRPAKFSLMYIKFVLMRYFRLLPTELICIAVVYNVLPAMGTGILWTLERSDGKMCYDGAGRDNCSQDWWTNVFFIQNVGNYMGQCFSHTWYLGVDMQLYLTAPFFCLAYGINRRAGWSALAVGMAVGVFLPMVMMAHYDWVPDNILGNGNGQENSYQKKVYMNPFCRLSPFLTGIALAWLWEERFKEHKGRHLTLPATAMSYALALLGLGLCCAATFLRSVMFQCDLTSCMHPDTNPASKFFMYMWTGFAIPAWSVGVGLVMILCFQDRFIPLFQGFLHQPFWQPVAKLCYSAYLIHTSVLILNFCQRDSPLSYASSTFFFSFVAFVALSLAAAYALFLLVEKPLANLQAKLMGGAE